MEGGAEVPGGREADGLDAGADASLVQELQDGDVSVQQDGVVVGVKNDCRNLHVKGMDSNGEPSTPQWTRAGEPWAWIIRNKCLRDSCNYLEIVCPKDHRKQLLCSQGYKLKWLLGPGRYSKYVEWRGEARLQRMRAHTPSRVGNRHLALDDDCQAVMGPAF